MELEETKIEQIKGVIDTLKDYCTHRFECHGCPFETDKLFTMLREMYDAVNEVDP